MIDSHERTPVGDSDEVEAADASALLDVVAVPSVPSGSVETAISTVASSAAANDDPEPSKQRAAGTSATRATHDEQARHSLRSNLQSLSQFLHDSDAKAVCYCKRGWMCTFLLSLRCHFEWACDEQTVCAVLWSVGNIVRATQGR